MVEQASEIQVATERKRRERIWRSLQEYDRKANIPLLSSLGLHSELAGIFSVALYTDSKTVPINVALNIVTYPMLEDDYFALLHLKKSDQQEAGVGLKNLERYCLPVFFVRQMKFGDTKYEIQIGWLLDVDMTNRTYLFSLGDDEPPTHYDETPAKFCLVSGHDDKQVSIKARNGQPLFKYSLIKHHGCKCAFCGMKIYELLEAAHIYPYAKGGSNDVRNGLLLCRNHHKAFDCGLIKIHPDTLNIELKDGIQDQLNIKVGNLSHLKNKPHTEALRWAWNNINWTGGHK